MQTRRLWVSLVLALVVFWAIEVPGQQITNIVAVYPVGFHLVSNPLRSTNNDVSNIFKNPPPLLTLSKRSCNCSSSFDSATWDPDIPGWSAPLHLPPGEGVWLLNPGPGNYTNVFVGEMVLCSTNTIPAGYSLKSQIYPSSTLANYSPVPFETLFFYKNGGYETYTFDPDLAAWSPSEPPISVGGSFWISNPGPPRNWVICPEAGPWKEND